MGTANVPTIPDLLVAQVVLPYDESQIKMISTEAGERPQLSIFIASTVIVLVCTSVVFLRRRRRTKYRNR